MLAEGAVATPMARPTHWPGKASVSGRRPSRKWPAPDRKWRRSALSWKRCLASRCSAWTRAARCW